MDRRGEGLGQLPRRSPRRNPLRSHPPRRFTRSRRWHGGENPSSRLPAAGIGDAKGRSRIPASPRSITQGPTPSTRQGDKAEAGHGPRTTNASAKTAQDQGRPSGSHRRMPRVRTPRRFVFRTDARTWLLRKGHLEGGLRDGHLLDMPKWLARKGLDIGTGLLRFQVLQTNWREI